MNGILVNSKDKKLLSNLGIDCTWTVSKQHGREVGRSRLLSLSDLLLWVGHGILRPIFEFSLRLCLQKSLLLLELLKKDVVISLLLLEPVGQFEFGQLNFPLFELLRLGRRHSWLLSSVNGAKVLQVVFASDWPDSLVELRRVGPVLQDLAMHHVGKGICVVQHYDVLL